MKTSKLHSLFLTCHSACTDTRSMHPNAMFFALKGDNFNGNTYAKKALEAGAKYAIVDEESANTSDNTILVHDVLTTLQELASFHRSYLNTPIIALTGSNGKTTTKELINAVLSKKYNTTATIGNLNNHIGVPVTLLSMTKNTEIGIVEMGANHLKEIEFLCSIAKPDFGYITNFGKAHLEGFGGVEGVIKGKSEMYAYLIKNNKTIFINTTDKIQVDKTIEANTYTFGNSSDNNDVNINFIKAQPFVISQYNDMKVESCLIGDYNFNNIAAAITIGNYFKVDDDAIKTAIEHYTPTNNRSQIITKGTNKIILDAYNANPTSMQAALLNFEKQKGFKIAILGDMFELGEDAKTEHQNIVNLVETLDIDSVYFLGENFHSTHILSEKAISYSTFSDFESEGKINTPKGSNLLIKGSRGMALERVLELL
ncbi:UDP-N-acetylmuramoyl-tripeptide--D-alanyl-D-alanine ligase [Tamlana sp. 2_MG-2023]|uniref:UDP-N-acetylmuramoyl-tripeptide--D-alanyl-D- alanine ligase n=1 Tax=unclassified Tamlana TaxID=2614803 RepID=UPI0026E382A4|nr:MULTISPECIES: UDP-N-acetylmuramoyl-tripeptide--D-alanyl-D-alanine ligase [unclassified Tamlana]MDO6760908.1 UDP-N-acetylmuramoyl-tripeptide--D-alanyl-D-alanine ligase [Tamlana sp. 2_MG-2023]MDO6791164.1 UDP-N-acetylmuramoyl-tripeptide--D-alanyl-D-alanine ligase [Tamlana sp. 1_MG-2023]